MTLIPPSLEGAATPEVVPYTPPDDHTPILYTEMALPAATGSVPCELEKDSMAKQQSDVIAFYEFLKTPSPQLARLNQGTKRLVAMVNIPKRSAVKVVFCSSWGLCPISEPSPINEKLLVLQGNGNTTVGPPQPLCLPADTVQVKRRDTMTKE